MFRWSSCTKCEQLVSLLSVQPDTCSSSDSWQRLLLARHPDILPLRWPFRAQADTSQTQSLLRFSVQGKAAFASFLTILRFNPNTLFPPGSLNCYCLRSDKYFEVICWCDSKEWAQTANSEERKCCIVVCQHFKSLNSGSWSPQKQI